MTIYYYIGTSKTGSTTLARFLSLNREKLLDQGVLYPRSLGKEKHYKLTAYGLSDGKLRRQFEKKKAVAPDLRAFRAGIETELIEEVSKAGCDSIVLLHERSSTKLKSDGIRRVKQMLDRLRHPIKIIVYLRRQDQKITSGYSTNVKNGRTGKLVVPQPSAKKYNILDYEKLLSRWSDVFGFENVNVRIFEKSFLKNGSLLDDFCEAASIQITSDLVVPENQNESLDRYAVEYLRLINHYLPKQYDGGARLDRRGDIFKLLSRLSQNEKVRMSRADALKFYSHFADSNKAVRDLYFPERPKLFTEDFDQHCQEETELSPAKIMEISAKLWALKHGECQKLKQQVDDLQTKLKKYASDLP